MAEAAKVAGMERTSAHHAVEQMRERLPVLMDECGLDVRAILLRLRDKLDAEETKFFAHEGKVVETRNVHAHGVQLKALELAANLRPELAQRGNVSIGTVNVLWAGDAPAWAKPEPMRDANALPNGKANADANVVITDSLSKRTRHPEVQLKVLESDPGVSPHTHSAPRTKKKRGPRLPIYRGDK